MMGLPLPVQLVISKFVQKHMQGAARLAAGLLAAPSEDSWPKYLAWQSTSLDVQVLKTQSCMFDALCTKSALSWPAADLDLGRGQRTPCGCTLGTACTPLPWCRRCARLLSGLLHSQQSLESGALTPTQCPPRQTVRAHSVVVHAQNERSKANLALTSFRSTASCTARYRHRQHCGRQLCQRKQIAAEQADQNSSGMARLWSAYSLVSPVPLHHWHSLSPVPAQPSHGSGFRLCSTHSQPQLNRLQLELMT